MAIIFDNFTESDAPGAGSGTEPFVHITGNGSGRILILTMHIDSLADTVSSVTYGGDTLTELVNLITPNATRLYVGYILSPRVGSYNIDVVFTGGPPTVFRGGALTFKGVSQTTPIGATNSTSRVDNTTTTIETIVTTTGSGGIVIDAIHGTRTSPGNAKTPQIEKMNNSGTWGGGVNHIGGVSYVSYSTATTAMVWENMTFDSGAADQIHYAFELLPSSGGDSALLLGSD